MTLGFIADGKAIINMELNKQTMAELLFLYAFLLTVSITFN